MSEIIEVYCDGAQPGEHERWFTARMVRSVVVDGSTAWAVAREYRNRRRERNVAGRDPDEHEYNRFNLRCGARGCTISAQAHLGSDGHRRLTDTLDTLADADAGEVPLRAIAARVSSTG